MTTPHVAFRSSDSLHQRTDAFIQRMNSGAKRPEPKEIEAIMAQFIEEALAAFITRAAQAADLSPGMFKVVNMTCSTISKTTHLVIGRSAKKMDLAQNQAAADYMDQVRHPATDGDHWYVAFPASEAHCAQCRDVIRLCQQGEEDKARRELAAYLLTLTDEAIDWYFQRPMALLGFGPVLRKVANVGVETTRKASRSLISNLIPKLGPEQLLASAQYQESMLLSFPPRTR